MRSNIRKLKAMFNSHSINSDNLFAVLEGSSIPLTGADCRTCSEPCEGHESYPNKFDVDMESQMLGSVKPYFRQVVISTGKTDWEKEVTEAQGTLAAFLLEVASKVSRDRQEESEKESTTPQISGVFKPSDSTRLAILNGSHDTVCDDCTLETVIVFPDYKVVTGVPRSLEGAADFWEHVLSPSLGRVGSEKSSFKTWVLPYSCVILLCSHKKRDNRCSIAAPKLASKSRGWETHTQLGDLSLSNQSPLEDLAISMGEKDLHIIDCLRSLPPEKKALILRNSHTGGHRYAGNCIIYTPEGSGVWYGRVTPHEVESIVENTIVGGKVLPPLLRGGINISRPGCNNLHDW